jgi:hypothetical protein
MNWLPFPSSLFTVMFQGFFWINSWLRISPRPVPSSSLVPLVDICSSILNSLSIFFKVIPKPVSIMCSSIVSLFSCELMVMVPPFGIVFYLFYSSLLLNLMPFTWANCGLVAQKIDFTYFFISPAVSTKLSVSVYRVLFRSNLDLLTFA